MYIDVSYNGGTPKSSLLVWDFHFFELSSYWGICDYGTTPYISRLIFRMLNLYWQLLINNTHIYIYTYNIYLYISIYTSSQVYIP